MFLDEPFSLFAGNLMNYMIVHLQLLGNEWQDVIEVRTFENFFIPYIHLDY